MENSKPVLVIGSTGFLGMEICRQLVAAHKPVRGLVRPTSDPLKVEALNEMGVETVVGDIKDRSSLDRTFQNAGAIISTASSTLSRIQGDSIETVDRLGQLNVVDAAQNAGVGKFVFISFTDSSEKFPLQDAKREVEKRLIQSNMNYTILRPTFFMEVWLGPYLGFDAVDHKATIYGHGAGKISWISLKDVAAFAVGALDNQMATQKIIDLGGPEALSPLEVIRLFEQESGASFQLQYVPEEVIRTQLEKSNDPLEQSFSALMLAYAGGVVVPMEETKQQFNLNMIKVEEYIQMVGHPHGQMEEVGH